MIVNNGLLKGDLQVKISLIVGVQEILHEMASLRFGRLSTIKITGHKYP